MAEQPIKVVEFDIASFNFDKHPSGVIISFKDETGSEVSITAEPGESKHVTVSYSQTTKGKNQEHNVLRLSLKEIAVKLGFQPLIKEKIFLTKKKSAN